MKVNLLQYPQKSHRKTIHIPPESAKLAELVGILFGDGKISNNWQATVSLSAIADNDYSKYVCDLFTSLFTVNVAVRKRLYENTLKLVVSSTSLVDFLLTKEVVKGNKVKQKIDMPYWIQKNFKYKTAFVRGLVDTDGCLYIHRHNIRNKLYNNIGFCYTSYSEPLIDSVSKTLDELSITHSVTSDKRIYIYKQLDIEKYLRIFGSKNPRIYQKYNIWRDSRVV